MCRCCQYPILSQSQLDEVRAGKPTLVTEVNPSTAATAAGARSPNGPRPSCQSQLDEVRAGKPTLVTEVNPSTAATGRVLARQTAPGHHGCSLRRCTTLKTVYLRSRCCRRTPSHKLRLTPWRVRCVLRCYSPKRPGLCGF
jgi:hypothetical protein